MHDRLVSRRIDALHQCFLVCMFDEDSIKMKSLSSGQHFPHSMSMGDSYVNSPICPKPNLS